MELIKDKPKGWTPFISWENEAIHSNTAIRHKLDNFPTKEHLANMQVVVERIFLPLRKFFAEPIRVTSFYRSPEVNKKVGKSSKTSQHMVGEAIDLSKDANSKFTNKQLFDYIRDHLDFDQLIWEYGTKEEPKWVHVSFKATGKNRKQILYILN